MMLPWEKPVYTPIGDRNENGHPPGDEVRDWMHRNLKVILVFFGALITLAIPTIFSIFMGPFDVPEGGAGDSNDLYSLIISSIIALIGVLVTGFIFLSENLRGIVETDPSYERISVATKSFIVGRLKVIAIASILASVFYTLVVLMPFMSDGQADLLVRLAEMLSLKSDLQFDSAIVFLRWFQSAMFLVIFEASLYYSLRMIRMKETMDWYADKEIEKVHKEIARPIVVTLDAEEFNDLSEKDAIHPSPDSFKRQAGKKNHYEYDPNKIFFVSEIRRDEIVQTLSTGQFKVRDIDCNFDIKQTVSVFNTIEKILAKMLDVDHIMMMDKERLEALFSPRMRSWDISSIPDDISMRYYNIRDFRDLFQIRRTKINEKLKRDSAGASKGYTRRFQEEQKRYLETMQRNVYVLITELVPHLDEKRLANMDLSNFQASTQTNKINLRQTDLSECNLKNIILMHADLRNANLTHSDLTDADLRSADLTGANLTDALASKLLLNDKTKMEGMMADRVNVYETQFFDMPLNFSGFRGAMFRDDEFEDCSILDANFEGALLHDTSFINCVINKTRMRGAIITGSIFDRCAMIESILSESYIAHTTMTETDLSGSIIQDIKMISVQSKDTDFSKCQLDDSLIQGCHFFAPSMNDLLARGVRLDNTSFDQYLLRIEDVPSGDRHVPEEAYRVLPDKKGLEFLHYRLEGSGKTKAEETPPLKMGAVNNPFPLMMRAILDRSMISNTKFAYVMCSGSSFSDCSVKDTSFEWCNLSNSRFMHSEIVNTAFSNCNLFQVDFRRAYLDFCLFQNVEHLNISRMEDVVARRSLVMNCTLTRKHLDYFMSLSKPLQMAEMLEASLTDEGWEKYRIANGILSAEEVMKLNRRR